MGCFGKKPKINIPEAPQLKTADAIFKDARAAEEINQPLALGARESALSDLGRGSDYYAEFGPTSFEQALSSQYFSNVIDDVERSIKHNLSLSGIASSPILARQIAEQRGNLGVDIGQYLTNLGNQRALFSLQSRLGIDPFHDVLAPRVNADMLQSNAQKDAQFQRDLLQAQADFANSQGGGMGGSIGALAGAGLGALLAIPTGGLSIPAGAALGAGLGGAAGNLFDGGQSPISMGDSLSLFEGFGGRGTPATIPTQRQTQQVNPFGGFATPGDQLFNMSGGLNFFPSAGYSGFNFRQ